MQNSVVNVLSAVIAVVSLCGAADRYHFPSHDWGYKKHPNWSLLPHNECGFTEINRKHKIIGGAEAYIGQFPWMVGLLDPNEPIKTAQIFCGGSLINDRYVVSAAHCSLSERYGLVKYVVLGEHYQNTVEDCDDFRCSVPAITMRVEENIIHPAYRTVGHPKHAIALNDISLLRLRDRVANYNEFIRPICLPTFTSLQGESLDGCDLETSGWGAMGPYKASPSSDVLRWVHVLISDEECSTWNPYMLTQICAKADEGADSCPGDSGGPLMATVLSTTRRSYVTVLVGVTSYGSSKDEYDSSKTCGSHIGVYTKVTQYVDWILDTIRK
uniref:Peptidase S1 domain-containing protein n=1 Tax=Graphocephala atropunctata TaxID=36148 RepID=A0A1B6KWM7_9HEMI